MIVIIIGAIVGIWCVLAPNEKEITEEDYKKNPKYLLEEVIVSEGKHFKLPKVKKCGNMLQEVRNGMQAE